MTVRHNEFQLCFVIDTVAAARMVKGITKFPVFILSRQEGTFRLEEHSINYLHMSIRDLFSQHISKLLPQLSGIALVQEGQINPRLAYLCRCGHLFSVESQHGDIFPSELSLVNLEYAGSRFLRLFVLPALKEAS